MSGSLIPKPPLQIFDPPDSVTAALARLPTPADAWEANTKAYSEWSEREKQDGIAKGLIDPQTGWPTQAALVDAAHQYGAAMLGSTSAPGSGSTQIAGTTPMYRRAAEWLMQRKPDAKTVLDYGAGLGLGADAMREVVGDRASVHTLEPNPERWKGKHPPTYTDDSQIKSKYDLITNTNVLNVLPRQIRDGVVKDIGDKLAPGGHALITTRGWSGDVAATKNFVPGDEPNSLFIKRGNDRVFQKGFDGNELQDYAQSLLGDEFSIEKVQGFGKAAVLISRKAVSAPAAAQVNPVPIVPAAISPANAQVLRQLK